VSTDRGINKIEINDDVITTYLCNLGQFQSEFNRLSSFYDSTRNRLYFGGLSNLWEIDLDIYKKSIDLQNNPALEIIGFTINDGRSARRIRSDEIEKGIKIIKGRDALTIDMSLLSFDDPEDIQYQYQLNKKDQEYGYFQLKDKSIEFSNIPRGNYMLRLRARGASNEWIEYSQAIIIKSVLPIYLSTWFIALMSALLISFGFIYNQQRIIKLRKRKNKLEIAISKATIQLQKDKEHIKLQAEELSKVNKNKDFFVNNIAHELRTPLTLVKGPIDLIMSKSLDKIDTAKLLTTIQLNSNKLSDLISDLVQISKLDSGVKPAVKEVFSLHKLINNIIRSLDHLINVKKLTLNFNYTLDKKLNQEYDRNYIEKIITNLLTNAIKFSYPNGTIGIHVNIQGSELVINVSDNGPGISHSEKNKIFIRYYQSEITSNNEGLGIGLAYSRSLAERMGGKLVLVDKDTPGATFELRLPKSLTSTKIKKIKTLKKHDHAKRVIKEKSIILIIEDNFEVQDFLGQTLSHKFKIIKAYNGFEAFDLLSALNANDLPDIIISDVMMPEMDGIEFLQKLRTHKVFFNIPVIMLTAKTAVEDKLKAFHIGIDDYITKPFDIDELLVRLKNIEDRILRRDSFNMVPVYALENAENGNQWLLNIQNLVEDNLTNNLLSVDFLAEQMDLSRMHLNRKLKEQLGISPAEYIKEVKLNRARSWIENGEDISVISERLGYFKLPYFKKIYTERFGTKL